MQSIVSYPDFMKNNNTSSSFLRLFNIKEWMYDFSALSKDTCKINGRECRLAITALNAEQTAETVSDDDDRDAEEYCLVIVPALAATKAEDLKTTQEYYGMEDVPEANFLARIDELDVLSACAHGETIKTVKVPAVSVMTEAEDKALGRIRFTMPGGQDLFWDANVLDALADEASRFFTNE